jgi:hypothetical protein
MSAFDFDMSSPNVRIYSGALRGQLTGEAGEVGKYMRKLGRRMVAGAKAQVGVESGDLRRSIRMIHGSNAGGQFITIGSPLSYAYDHHQGTRPHLIRPTDHKFLRFSTGGRVIYSRLVMHPGTRPNHYLSDQLYMVRV